MNRRVVLAMSGGVDSSVAAHLLQRAGWDVVGVFMRHGSEPDACGPESAGAAGLELTRIETGSNRKQGCCGAADAADARAVAERLGLPFYALNLQDDFGRIINYFVEEYVAGRTPNPCVVCNTWLKFGRLFDYADSIGAEHVATGHHARLIPMDGGEVPSLCRGLDPDKDQSYALFGVQRERLRRMLLPVGGYRKSEIRQMATSLNLRVADKRDSQEICFVTSGGHANFVGRRKGDRDTRGQIVTTEGQVVGEHNGIEHFTVGQRKGLGVALGEPFFVVALEPDRHRVVIGRRPELARGELTAERCNWLIDLPATRFRCEAQTRYNSSPVAATVTPLPEARMHVAFDQPCYGVAPGQAVVCYEQQRVLGGGWIER
jgi:tRNA-specific 2-thiouridylase